MPLHRLLWHDLKTPISQSQGAIPLLEVRKQDTKQAVILLTPRGRQLLCDCKDQTHVISITGTARCGKSSRGTLFLQTLKDSKETVGFRSAPGTTKVVTLGLWVYPKTLSLPDGSKCLLLDCEGMFRGRDSITSLLSKVAVGLSTCLVYCMKDGLTNTVMHQTSRMIDNLPLLTPATQKRKLMYWCTNLDDEWKRETGDIQSWLRNYLVEAPRVPLSFEPSVIITPPPHSKDTILEEFEDVKSVFGKANFKEVQNVVSQTVASPLWHEGKMVNFVESEVQLYTRNLSGVMPSLINQIHQQQVNAHFSHLLNQFKSNIGWYKYALWKSDVPQAVTLQRQETLRTFRHHCNQEHLLLTVIEEARTKLDQACTTYQEEIVRAWQNSVAEHQRQQEEKRRLEIEAELKKQEEAKRKEEDRLKQEQIRLQAERARLEALHWAEFERHMAASQRHHELVQKHIFVPHPPVGGEGGVVTYTWGNGKQTHYTFIKSGGYQFLHSVCN